MLAVLWCPLGLRTQRYSNMNYMHTGSLAEPNGAWVRLISNWKPCPRHVINVQHAIKIYQLGSPFLPLYGIIIVHGGGKPGSRLVYHTSRISALHSFFLCTHRHMHLATCQYGIMLVRWCVSHVLQSGAAASRTVKLPQGSSQEQHWSGVVVFRSNYICGFKQFFWPHQREFAEKRRVAPLLYCFGENAAPSN